MSKPEHSSEKIEEALQLLREAADEKKEELQGLFSGKYSDLRDSVVDIEGAVTEKLQELAKKAARAKTTGERKAREIGADIDEKVHEDAWHMMGWAAVAALIVGYF